MLSSFPSWIAVDLLVYKLILLLTRMNIWRIRMALLFIPKGDQYRYRGINIF